MSKTIDQKVVEMQFNNKDFEKNVKTSMSTLDKLKNLLNFGKETKSLEQLQRQADSVKFNGLANTVETLASKFSGLQMAATLAMYKIADAAANAGLNMVKSLSIDNVTAGWAKLQQKASSMSTLISQGYSTEVVEKQLEKLNWFSDETSYNFTDMIDNIAKFTASGQDLQQSVTAMEGIALWAAKSGQNAQKASGAMYQLSQALGAGFMRKEDWKSIQNASMDTSEFRQETLEAAVALGTLKKVGDDTYQALTGNKEKFTKKQFAESLTEGQWFTSEVMMKVYTQYAKGAEQVKTIIDKMDEKYDIELVAGDLLQAYSAMKSNTFDKFLNENNISGDSAEELKKMVTELDAFGISTLKAGQEYRTFNDVLDATKDAVSTKWMGIFETIIGNIDQQKALWSSIGEQFYDWFAEPLNGLNNKLKDWAKLGGRDSLFAGLSNIGKAISAIFTPIKEAFQDIFPATTAKRLAELTEKFKEFTSRLIIGEKTMNKIKATFKGLFSITKTGYVIFSSLVKAAFNLIEIFLPLGDGILTVTAALGKWLEKTTKVVRDSHVISTVINKIVDTVKIATQKIKEFIHDTLKLDNILNFFRGMFTFIQKIGLAIGKVFASIIRNGDLKSVLDVFNTGLFGGLIITVTKLFKNLSEATKNLGDTFKGIQGLLKGVKDILAAYTEEINSKTLLNIAKAVALLAASLFILSLIPSDKIMSSLGALAGIMTEFMLMFKVFTKISGDVSKVGRSSIAMVSMSLSILILASALKKIGSLDFNQMITGLTGIAGAMTVLILAMKKMPNRKHMIRNSLGMIAMAAAMNIMASAIRKMGSLSILEIGKGLLAMAGSLFIVSKAMNSLPNKGMASKSAGLLVMTTSLLILAQSLKMLSTLSWDDIARSLTAMGGALILLTITMNKMPSNKVTKDGKISAINMIAVTTSMVILAKALKMLATLSWNDIARSLTAMGGALAELVLASVIMNKTGSSTKGLLVASAALIVFAIGMRTLSKISWEGIAKSVFALAVGIGGLVIAAKLLSPVVGTLLAVSGAAALFGLACVAFGAGLILISTGIGALAVALSGGATAIVAGLAAIILGILGMVPEIIKIGAMVILGLAESIIELSPILAKALGTLIYEAVKMLADYIPMIVTAVMDLIINTMRAISDRLPELIVAGVELLESFFRGFVEAFKTMDPKVFMSGIKAIALLTVAFIMMGTLAALFPLAMAGVLAFGVLVTELALVIAGVSKVLNGKGMDKMLTNGGNLLMLIGTAIGKFVGGIVGGIGAGISNSMPSIATNLSEFMKNLDPFMSKASSIDPSILGKIALLSGAILVLSAANFISGIAKILSFGQTLPDLGKQLGEFMSNAQPFIEASNMISPNMLSGVNALTGAIVALTGANILKGITSFLTGGDQSFAKFGKEIASLGYGMRFFVKNLGTFSSSQVTTIKAACDGITALAEASRKIPNEGGLWGWLAGDNSLGKFSAYLPALGTNLSKFVTSLGSFSSSQIDTVGAASSAVKILSEAAKEIPNEGGLWGWLAGDNSLGKFSDKLPALGENLKIFVTNLGTFNEAQVTAADSAGRAIIALAKAAKEIPASDGLWQSIVGNKSLASFGVELPLLGTCLKTFVNNLGTFDESKVNTIKSAGDSVIALAEAANKIPAREGLWQVLAGKQSLAVFGKDLPSLGSNLSRFVSSLGTFSEAQVITTDCAGKAIVALGNAAGSIPAQGACWEWLLGKKSLVEFASDLPMVGFYLSSFVRALGTFDEAQVKTADSAGKAIVALGTAAGNIPARAGLWQAIVGKQSLAEFGGELPQVGWNLALFARNLGTFDETKVAAIDCAGKAITALATASSNIQNSGGMVSWFTGDNDIEDFAEKLPIVGTSLNKFIKNLGTFGQPQIDTVNASTEAMKALAKFDDIDVKKVNDGMIGLSSNLSVFGKSLSSFASGVSSVSSDTINDAITKMNSVIDMSKNIATINVKSLETFGDSLKEIGDKSLTGFVESFAGNEPKDKASRGIRDLIMNMLTAAESKREEIVDKFKSMINSTLGAIQTKEYGEKYKIAGKYFAQGFANGINENRYLVIDAGTALGNAAYESARRSIDAHSPSKKAHKLGSFFGQGFVNAITEYGALVYDESYNMGSRANKGLNKGISSINNIMGDTFNGSPTIKPILDLTDVKSGANSINGMLNNLNINPSLNAISIGMNRKGQNGMNDDVVSAINKLGSTLNTPNNTYNINGVTYGADGEISEAIGVLLRAANVERRS